MAKPAALLDNEGAKKSLDGRIQRRNYGRGHGYLIDGTKAEGVTGILGGSVPKNALVGWAAGAVGQFVYDEPEETVRMAQRMGAEAFVKAMKEVPSNDRDQAANKGTAVHKMAELIARGEEVDVEDYLAGHVDSYLDFREHHRPRKEMLEVVVAHLKYRYAGTTDGWAHMPMLKGMMATFPEWTDLKGNRRGGRKIMCEHDYECLTLLDIKTSRSGVFSETAYQCCAYGYATHYIDAAAHVREMPKIEHYVSLWLRSDGWELIPFDVCDDDHRTFLYMQQVARATDWKNGRFATIRGEALPIPMLEADA